MDDWGGLDGGEAPAAGTRSASAHDQATGWGALDGGSADDRATPAVVPPPPGDQGAFVGWGSLDGAGPRHARSDQPSRGGADDAPALSPEATGSLLNAGERVWVNTEPGLVALGSGQRLTLSVPQTDRLYGWRQACIVDPATLTAELVPIPVASLRPAAGDDPMTVYRPPVPPAQRSPERVPGFPVGAGPDLHHLLDQRIAAAKEQYRRMADEAQAQAQAQIAEAGRQARAHADEAQRQAHDQVAQQRRWAEQEVARAERTAGQARAEVAQQLRQFQSAVQRSTRQAATMRMAAIGLGSLAAVLLLVVLAMISASLR